MYSVLLKKEAINANMLALILQDIFYFVHAKYLNVLFNPEMEGHMFDLMNTKKVINLQNGRTGESV